MALEAAGTTTDQRQAERRRVTPRSNITNHFSPPTLQLQHHTLLLPSSSYLALLPDQTPSHQSNLRTNILRHVKTT